MTTTRSPESVLAEYDARYEEVSENCIGLPCEEARDRADQLAQALRSTLAERDALALPYCLGETTIRTVATEGQLALEDGRAFIAASDLFKKDPYKERDELKARCDRYVEALKWYADHAGPISEWMDDMGSRAKQALEGQ